MATSALPQHDREALRDTAEDARLQRRTALWSLAAAAVLVVLKLGTGLLTGSLALVSAGIESSGDVIAAFLTLLAIRMALLPADRDHNYGHRRAENIAALGEAAIVFVGGSIIAFEAVRQLIEGGHHVDASWYVFVVIGLALMIDVSRIVVSLRAAKRWGSAAFRANAFNFAGDLAGSVAVLIGLGLVAAGFEQGDALAALLVACVIFFAVGRLAFENVRALMDFAPEDSRRAIEDAIAEAAPDAELRRLRLREVGGQVFADVTLGVSPATTVAADHETADRVEAAVRAVVPSSDVVVHAEPRMAGADLREQVLATALTDPDVKDAHDIAIYTDRGDAIVALHLKLDADSTLKAAHDAAERVESAIAALRPGVRAVHTHLEPIEHPVALLHEGSEHGAEADGLHDTVRRLLGTEPLECDLRETDVGPVLFLTVATDATAGLLAAHDLASELERDLRIAHPRLADVVVHTEPGVPAG
ncbi:cation diffusion facilitator family transporter [Patulibacter minatonensis]|uniref:cation diffusion facilitator family transporter n=1 Tax=Patulibacter minatonensis TaxID=298163 RepID=UPI00047EA4C6|nr:cation diffusion facilitator family transporter [Patulibacter minatonensis]